MILGDMDWIEKAIEDGVDPEVISRRRRLANHPAWRPEVQRDIWSGKFDHCRPMFDIAWEIR